MKRTPSSRSAARLLKGEPGAALDVAAHMLGRAMLIGAGLAVAGERQALLRNALVAAATIEVALIIYQASGVREDVLDGLGR